MHFIANAIIESNNYASSLLGQDFSKKESFSRTVAGEFSTSQSHSWELEDHMRPEEFGTLKTGGPENDYLVEGVIHTQGKRLSRKGNFKKISFNQNFSLHKK